MHMKVKAILFLASIFIFACKPDGNVDHQDQKSPVKTETQAPIEKVQKTTKVRTKVGSNEIVRRANEMAKVNAELESLIYDLQRDFKELEK